jgi:L,D-peptidoglycan transpeptidase YkuD (ErfK/YbiS/YcfS/YnhG family)
VLKSGGIFQAKIKILFVQQLPSRAGEPRGLLQVGANLVECAIGRSGIGVKRREGDGMTPIGRFAILGWLRRMDCWRSGFAGESGIRPLDGWCDDPGSRNYNRPVRLPSPVSAENLWREDHLYDVVGILDYNLRPRAVGRGSAVFFHLAHEKLQPTAGCVAVRARDMRHIQHRLAARPLLVIGSGNKPQREPKMADPTRTWVAPSWIACSKSALMPMESFSTPKSRARR